MEVLLTFLLFFSATDGADSSSSAPSVAENLCPKAFAIDIVLSHFVINDAFGRAEKARSFGAVAARGFQRIEHNIFFIGGDSFRQRQRCYGTRRLSGLQRRR